MPKIRKTRNLSHISAKSFPKKGRTRTTTNAGGGAHGHEPLRYERGLQARAISGSHGHEHDRGYGPQITGGGAARAAVPWRRMRAAEGRAAGGGRRTVQRRKRSGVAGDGCASSTPRRQGRADRKTYARKVFRVSRLKSLVFRKLASETISKPQPSPKRQCSHQALSSWLATTPTKGHPHPANPTAKIWKTRILRHNQPISFPKAR